MRFKKSPQLPGAERTRAWHYHESHMPTSGATLPADLFGVIGKIGKMAPGEVGV